MTFWFYLAGIPGNLDEVVKCFKKNNINRASIILQAEREGRGMRYSAYIPLAEQGEEYNG